MKLSVVVLLLALSGCATLPTGPSVNVLPSDGKPFDVFRAEDATCRQWAEQHMGVPAQDAYNQDAAVGAVAGTAIGAGLGAASGDAGIGAAIGAASGLLVGLANGAGAGQAYCAESQRRYDNAYIQCMYSYGNLTPEYPSPVVRVSPSSFPPPGEYSSYPSDPYVEEAL